MYFRLLAGTILSTTFAALGVAHAQTAAPDVPAAADSRDQVTVTATRVPQSVTDVPATVSVISDKQIDDELVTDIKDLMRYEPGVSVRAAPARFSAALASTGRDRNAGFNIRGIDGNRVLIVVDGVRVPDGFSFGPTANGRGDYVDLDLLKSVEILRGPASALYGSDGVAGAVSFITRDPDDLVKDGNMFGARARASYSSADDSISTGLIGATKVGDWSAMLSWTGRDAHETENQGTVDVPDSRRTTPNPNDFTSDAYLAKIVWAPGDTHRFRLTFDQLENESITEVLSGRARLPSDGGTAYTATSVLDLDARDTTKRTRVSFDHHMNFGDGFWRSAQWAVYQQTSDTRQFTAEDRFGVDRTRDNTFDNDIWGASGQIDVAFNTGWADHHIVVGGDYYEQDQEGIRSGTVPTPPDVFPTRAFPNTKYKLTGFYAQDQISLMDGVVNIYPALRYDSFELTPERDALFPAAVPISGSDGSRVSPKLGVVIWPVDWIGAFANYAAGYKAPEPSQVNNGFSNVAQSYTSIPNPDLKPESSESFEAGLRARNIDFLGADWQGEAVAFVADYENFITQLQVSGEFFNPLNPAVFQYVNLTEVSVNGAEAKLSAAWDNGFGFRFAASMASGEVRGAPNTPLESIDPVKFVAGLTYADPSGVFGGQLAVTHVNEKEDERVAQNIDRTLTGQLDTTNDLFTPGSFTTLDLTAYWNVTDWATLRAGAFNITDEKFWWWSDVRGVAATSTTVDAFTPPGSNYSVSLTLKY